MPNFWQLATTPISNSIISFDYSWFLAKNISNFVSLPWKLHNRYCPTGQNFSVQCILLCPNSPWTRLNQISKPKNRSYELNVLIYILLKKGFTNTVDHQLTLWEGWLDLEQLSVLGLFHYLLHPLVIWYWLICLIIL